MWVDTVQAHFEILCGVLNQYASSMKGLACCAEYSHIVILVYFQCHFVFEILIKWTVMWLYTNQYN